MQCDLQRVFLKVWYSTKSLQTSSVSFSFWRTAVGFGFLSCDN